MYKYKPSLTTAGATISNNTLNVKEALCRQIYIKSATSTTVFDVTLVDEDDFEVRKFTDVVGVLNDLTPFPVNGIYTLTISNSTRDEIFTILLCFSDT